MIPGTSTQRYEGRTLEQGGMREYAGAIKDTRSCQENEEEGWRDGMRILLVPALPPARLQGSPGAVS